MEDAASPPDTMFETLRDASVDLYPMDDIFFGGSWLEAQDGCSLLQPGNSTPLSPFDSSCLSPLFEMNDNSSNANQPENVNQDDTIRSDVSENPPSIEIGSENLVSSQPLDQTTTDLAEYTYNSVEFGNSELSRSWWIEPKAYMGSMSSVKERLSQALRCIKKSHRDSAVLVQVWVPIKRGNQLILSTCGQPFSLDPNCQRLVNYRTISLGYQFSTQENSNEVLGLPGRVFLGKVPEWTPDVRYFSIYEYARAYFAQYYDVRGTLAIPVFERDSQTCLGVVEVITTTEKINYRSDLENICCCLEAVDLRGSEGLNALHVKVMHDSYQAALPEISEIVRAVCEAHGLPLAQTWIPCIRQGREGSHHSDENHRNCVSMVDVACYVKDSSILGFHEACSEHHLFRGQGVAGKAFTINQPCFSSDITAFSKIEYPLSHHARMFKLRAAVAIRLRSIYTGSADIVLEFFLPANCIGSEEQKLILNSLFITIQQACRSLRVVKEKEFGDEAVLQVNELFSSHDFFSKHISGEDQSPNIENMLTVGVAPRIGTVWDESSWMASTVEAQQQGQKITVLPTSVSLGFDSQEFAGYNETTDSNKPEVVLPVGERVSEIKTHHQDSVIGTIDHGVFFTGKASSSNARKSKEKRSTKTEKTISLQVLQQHFSGSLKDAAKSIGVCPTTMKRICRQYGINRWPSRKIKKVGHSLRKLQVVIDSVQGVDGALQFSSLCTNFPSTGGQDFLPQKVPGSGTFSTLKQGVQPESSASQHGLFSTCALASNSLSSSCSQSSSSSHCCPSGAMRLAPATQVAAKEEASMEEKQRDLLKREHSEVKVHVLTQGTPTVVHKSHSHRSFSKNPRSGSLPPLHQHSHVSGSLKVKVIYGEEKVRFKLQLTWGFQDLKQEIAKRFNIDSTSTMDLKYLDDDSEWVLLTCDADLLECTDIYKSSRAHAIKISVHDIAHPRMISSLGSSGLS